MLNEAGESSTSSGNALVDNPLGHMTPEPIVCPFDGRQLSRSRILGGMIYRCECGCTFSRSAEGRTQLYMVHYRG